MLMAAKNEGFAGFEKTSSRLFYDDSKTGDHTFNDKRLTVVQLAALRNPIYYIFIHIKIFTKWLTKSHFQFGWWFCGQSHFSTHFRLLVLMGCLKDFD